ncbi:unnamed protein product [Closterium sp. NIES-54]
MGGAESGVAKPRGTASSGGPAGASPRLSSQRLSEWLVQRAHSRSGVPEAGEPGGARAGGAAVTTGVGDPTEPGAAGAGGAGAGVARVGGPGAGGDGGAGAGAVDPGAGGAGGTMRPRPYFVPLLQQVLGVPSSTGLPPPFLCPPPDQSQPPLQPASPLPVPSPYTEQSGGLTERREPASHPILPVRTLRRAPRLRPPPVPGTHTMALRPSSLPLRVPLPAPPESSLPAVPDPESDRARAASLTVARLLATAVTDPSFESAAASTLVAELLDFAAACRLDYASALVAESVPASPPSVGGECALGTDVLEDRQEDFECLAAALPCFASLLLAPEGDTDAPDIPTLRSYAEAITVDGMWIFRVKRPPGSPPAFKARYVARGFRQRQGVDYFHTFSPTPKMTTLQVLLHVAAQRDCALHSMDFSTAFLQGSLHEEIWLRRPPGFTGSFPTGTQWSLRRPVYGLRQAPHEWHDTLRNTLAALGFVPSTADPSLFLRTDTSLPPFYVLVYLGLQITRDRARRTITQTQSHMVHQVLQRFGFQYSSPQLTPLSTSHSLSAPPSDDSVESSGPYPELVGCLITSGMGLVLGGRGPVVLTGHADASWVDHSATLRSSQGYTFSLGSGSVSWRSTRSSLVLSSSYEAEIYGGAMAAQELCWLTYMLTDLGEQPRSPPVLYVDNKAMIALCQEHRLEHRTKHIALRYFLARELQQRGQLRLAYVATRANTADVFTKALPPADHQRFVTMLGLKGHREAVSSYSTRFSGADSTVPRHLPRRSATWTATRETGGPQNPAGTWHAADCSDTMAVDPDGTRGTAKSNRRTVGERIHLSQYISLRSTDPVHSEKRREQHLRDLDAVFKRLQENRLITKGSKCEFLKQILEFFGHVISRVGTKIDPVKIKTIQEWKSPMNVTELQNLLGFVNYVRRFIPNMAGITGPLIDLLHKDRNFVCVGGGGGGCRVGFLGLSGNDAVLVVVDHLTKMAHFAPCRTTNTAEETARLFISTVVRLHGIPLAIISDRDLKFTSKFWKETWAQYGTKLQFSSAYHPQTDGQTERTNQTMEQMKRTNCPDPVRWEDSLAMLEFAFNNAPSSLLRRFVPATIDIARQQAPPTARPVLEPTLDRSKI